MYRQMWYSFLIVAGLGLVWTDVVRAQDPDLVGWWEFNDGSGGVAYDSSGNGNHGTLEGGASIGDDTERGKVLCVNGVDGYATIPDGSDFDITDLTLMFWMKLSKDFDSNSALSIAPVGKVLDASNNVEFTLVGANMVPVGTEGRQIAKGAMYFKLEAGAYCYADTPNNTFWAANTWYHITGVHNHATASGSIYVNGELINTVALTGGSGVFNFSAVDAPLEIGRLVIEKAGNALKYFDGCIDDVRLYSRVLTAQEIQQALVPPDLDQATRPSPADNATDVLRDNVVLTWTLGEQAVQHDVFFGTDLESVRDATTATSAYMGRQTEARYALGRLDFGQTYYWRTDEINNGHPDSPWIGEVWSFTVEPVAIPLSGQSITATASSQDGPGTGPGNTIDGSGLIDGIHSQEPNDMWLSGEEPNGAWIQYTFDKPYKLHAVQVWNHNTELEKFLGFGIKEAMLSYSLDGAVWTELGTQELAQAKKTSVDLQDVAAKALRITAQSHWGALFAQYGLSEVRFEYIPTYAREPEPLSGSMVFPDAVLNWRAGREAAMHDVYVGMDANELTLADTVASNSYDTSVLDLQLGKTYYWRIDEVNEAETPNAWPGDVWNFSTPEYLIVEDFESYTDDMDAGEAIFQTWIDGWEVPANGSFVGKEPPEDGTFGERGIVHSGKQSMPMTYNNASATYSEATRTFDSPQDWTWGGVKTLVLFFSGDSANKGGRLYVKINGVKIPYEGDPGSINWLWWTQWNIDLASAGVTNLQNVTSLSIGVDGAGSSGTLYVDDIRLYALAPRGEPAVLWLEAESTASITEPMRVWSDIADASGGQYIAATSGNNSKGNPPTEGVATYTITVPGGTYRIVGRVIAPGGTSDSFWVRVQGAGIDVTTHASGWLHWSMENGTAWHWTPVNSYDAGSATVLFRMPAGTYTLEVAYREEGALLDAIAIVEDLSAPEPDVVLYEETFPNGEGNYKPLAWIGWEGYVGSNATEVTTTEPGNWNENNIIVDLEDNKAFHLMNLRVPSSHRLFEFRVFYISTFILAS